MIPTFISSSSSFPSKEQETLSDLKDRLLGMIQKESNMYNTGLYYNPKKQSMLPSWGALFRLSGNECHESATPLHRNDIQVLQQEKLAQWRQLIVSWMYVIAANFKLHPSVVAVAAYYLDCAVAKGLLDSSKTRSCTPLDYQAIALTSFHMAIKCYESRIFPLSELLKLSQGGIRAEDLLAMEQRMLSEVLQWKMHPPTPACYVDIYMEAMKVKSGSDANDDKLWTNIKEQTYQVIQIAICSGKFAQFPPSVLGLASLLIVLHKTLLLHSSRFGSSSTLVIGNERVQMMLLELQSILIESHSREVLSLAMAEVDPICTIDESQWYFLFSEHRKNLSIIKGSNNHKVEEDDLPTVATEDDSYQSDMHDNDDEEDDMEEEFQASPQDEDDQNCCQLRTDFFSKQTQVRRTTQSPRHVVIER